MADRITRPKCTRLIYAAYLMANEAVTARRPLVLLISNSLVATGPRRLAVLDVLQPVPPSPRQLTADIVQRRGESEERGHAA